MCARAVMTRLLFSELPATLTIAAASHPSEDFVLSDEIAIDINPSTCSVAAL